MRQECLIHSSSPPMMSCSPVLCPALHLSISWSLLGSPARVKRLSNQIVWVIRVAWILYCSLLLVPLLFILIFFTLIFFFFPSLAVASDYEVLIQDTFSILHNSVSISCIIPTHLLDWVSVASWDITTHTDSWLTLDYNKLTTLGRVIIYL